MIHLVPDSSSSVEGKFANHCNYYYDENFFNVLARDCEYEVIENKLFDSLRLCAVIKTKNDFSIEKDTLLKNITNVIQE